INRTGPMRRRRPKLPPAAGAAPPRRVRNVSAECCARPARADRESPREPASFLRRFRNVAEWMAPGAMLVLVPKCPVCVAAYVAMLTGVGLSLSAAAHLRMLVLTACLVTLALVASRRLKAARAS